MIQKIKKALKKEPVQVFFAAVITLLITFLFLGGDAELAFFAGFFVIVLYWFAGTNGRFLKLVDTKEFDHEGYFNERVVNLVIVSLLMLVLTRLFSGAASSMVVDYCKPGIVHSEKFCAIQKAKDAILEKYDQEDIYR